MKLYQILNEGLKFARSEEDIKRWFDDNRLTPKYSVANGKVTLHSPLKISGFTDMKGLGVQFDKAERDFELLNNGFVTLKGCPREVNGKYLVAGNSIKTLAGGPKVVNECVIHNTDIVNLEGAPDKVDYLTIRHNKKLTSLDGIPKNIARATLYLSSPIPLDGLAKCNIDEELVIEGVTSLKGIGKLNSCRIIVIPDTVNKNILGLIMIENLKDVSVKGSYRELEKALKLIKPYFGTGRANKKVLFDAQEVLMNADLNNFAQL